jgi:thioesterase domain-containing protein
MAAAYIEVLKPRLEGHPWILCGWCYGGIVAYEMARQLAARGLPKPRVIMIEAWAQSPKSSGQRMKLKLAKIAAMIGMPWNHRLQYIKSRLSPPAPADNGQTEDHHFSRSVIYQANMKAIQVYQPEPYDGDLDLLFSKDPAPDAIPIRNGGWHVLGANCHVYPISGEHDLALRPPHVAELADCIKRLIDPA